MLAHKWFEGFDWDGLANLTLPPPWRPQIKKADDAAFFDDSADGDASISDGDGSPKKYAPEMEAMWESLQRTFQGSAGEQWSAVVSKNPSPSPMRPKKAT